MTNVGTRVFVKQQRRNKLTPTLSQYPYLVKGNIITVFNKNNGHTITTRNISFSEVMPVTEKAPKAKIEIEWDEKKKKKKKNENFMLNLYDTIQVNDKNTKKALGNSRKKKKISKNKQGKEKVLLKDLIYCKH